MKTVHFAALLALSSQLLAWQDTDIDSAWRSENLDLLREMTEDTSFSSLYAHYRMGMVAINNGDKKTAKSSLSAVTKTLKGKYSTADEAALYSASLGLSIALKPWQAAFIAGNAEDALDFAFAENPNHAPALMVKGIAMYNTPSFLGGDRQEALAYFDKALASYAEQNAWGYEDAWLWKAKALYAIGQSDDAEASLAALLEAFPDFIEAKNLDLTDL